MQTHANARLTQRGRLRLVVQHMNDHRAPQQNWPQKRGFPCDVAPGRRSMSNESPKPARLGQGLDHETHQAHSGADHPQVQDRPAADRPGQDRRGALSTHRGDATHLPPLAPAVPGMQVEEIRRLTPLEKENARLKKLLAESELEKAML